jgi:NADPH:quinone reductase-like Zn-dependent oxidoreductase
LQLVKGLKDKWLKPVIGKEFPLEQASEAHRLIGRSRAFGKTILVP